MCWRQLSEFVAGPKSPVRRWQMASLRKRRHESDHWNFRKKCLSVKGVVFIMSQDEIDPMDPASYSDAWQPQLPGMKVKSSPCYAPWYLHHRMCPISLHENVSCVSIGSFSTSAEACGKLVRWHEKAWTKSPGSLSLSRISEIWFQWICIVELKMRNVGSEKRFWSWNMLKRKESIWQCFLVGWQLLKTWCSQGGNLPRDSKQANAERLESYNKPFGDQ